jgi:hypothetical protein
MLVVGDCSGSACPIPGGAPFDPMWFLLRPVPSYWRRSPLWFCQSSIPASAITPLAHRLASGCSEHGSRGPCVQDPVDHGPQEPGIRNGVPAWDALGCYPGQLGCVYGVAAWDSAQWTWTLHRWRSSLPHYLLRHRYLCAVFQSVGIGFASNVGTDFDVCPAFSLLDPFTLFYQLTNPSKVAQELSILLVGLYIQALGLLILCSIVTPGTNLTIVCTTMTAILLHSTPLVGIDTLRSLRAFPLPYLEVVCFHFAYLQKPFKLWPFSFFSPRLSVCLFSLTGLPRPSPALP